MKNRPRDDGCSIGGHRRSAPPLRDVASRPRRATRPHKEPARSEHPMIRRALVVVGTAAALLAALPVAAQLNLYCSSPNTGWCQGMAVGFEKATGVKVAVVQKATGEMLAQIKAERANPKGDIWWAGAADNYLQAAEEGLLDEYRSPNVGQLYDWAQRITD